MLKRILFLLFYLFTWVVFFELARIFFLLYEWPYTRQTPLALVGLSLWHGLKMDLSMASYITVPICLFVITGLFLPFFSRKNVYIIYTAIILFIQLLLIVTDAEIYRAWGNRIDFTPLKYLSHPKEMWASISHLPVFLIMLLLIIVYLLLVWGFGKIMTKTIVLLKENLLWPLQGLIVLLFTGLLVIPIRGGLQLAPINQSSVYFCDNQFANNAAVNASWNFMHSVTKMRQLDKNPYEYMKGEDPWKYLGPLFHSEGKTEQVIHLTDSAKPNILFIVWESFTEKALHVDINGKPVIPCFPLLEKEGIYFSNCYSSGDRTDKGISAILSGYPALPKGSIVNYPDKTSRLSGLGKLFSAKGYSTHFYYGGEPEFANIKSYLSSQQFRQFVTREDFRKSEMNSKWGAHDGIVMKRLLEDLPRMQHPFLTTWLTLSSHEPFETPVPVIFPGNDIKTRFMNSLHYTDSCLFFFINELKKLPLWKNTIVIISADHGHYEPQTGKRADDYRIPILWLGGALQKKDTVISRVVSQLDMATSLVHQLGYDDRSFIFSKNIFDTTSGAWAFFTYNDGIGFVTDSSRILFDNAGNRLVFGEGKTDKSHTDYARALMQAVYADFLKR